MTPAEFITLRESCGLNVNEAAGWLGVNPRTIRRWERGNSKIPVGVATELMNISEIRIRLIQQILAKNQ